MASHSESILEEVDSRSVEIQVSIAPENVHHGTQVVREVCDIGIQCNIVLHRNVGSQCHISAEMVDTDNILESTIIDEEEVLPQLLQDSTLASTIPDSLAKI